MASRNGRAFIVPSVFLVSLKEKPASARTSDMLRQMAELDHARQKPRGRSRTGLVAGCCGLERS